MSSEFNNNPRFESSLEELNELINQIDNLKTSNDTLNIPVILKLGHSRSGSTLFTQWMASLQVFAYPSNFLSLFYKSPSIGARIFELMINEEYAYNKEFEDLKNEVDFKSISGKTSGLKSPNEFWKFWLEHFSFPYTPVSDGEFLKTANFKSFNREIELLNEVFKRPFIIKAHNINYYLNLFASNMNNAIYVHMYRDPIYVINSVINGRIRRWGDINHWFGWKPKEYEILRDMDVYHQVAGQVYFNEKAILDRKDVLGDRYLNFSYEEFCANPESVYHKIIGKINNFTNIPISKSYNGVSSFKPSSQLDNELYTKIKKAYSHFTSNYGELSYSS
ncbi:sulfotransferase [Mangrovimonas sp. AS39]|uniref:sulfotransferase n=1 Tax=Mangrovimonas futianensis TaxID=2895523 RepID=UPI001E576E21|nr:sulfotransferase [Mangrovimonas futianensis]MCF1190821.1 sulfotransferase [Mangrovimonas futianensis]MCF1194518.1 sulfotransferase [Mangrovimonas futianensis]